MAFQIPTLQELVDRVALAFELNLKGSDAKLFPNNVADSSKVIAGAVWEPFGFLDWIWRQWFVHLCAGDMLDRHGRELGMPRLDATFASGGIALTGTPGTLIAAGLEFKRSDGLRYVTSSGGTISAGGSLSVQASASVAGKTGNALPGVTLTLTSAFPGLNSAASVSSSGIGGGGDTEDHESYRSRLLYRKRHVPHGGAVHDYVMWGREVNSGITHVFVDPVSADNDRTSVGVWFLMADTYADGIPLASDAAIVRAYIDSKRPAGARVDVGIATAVPVDITITGLSPNNITVRDAALAELQTLFKRGMRVSTLSEPQSVYRSKIWEAVSVAAGEDHHVITVPSSDLALTEGQIATLGSVTFV